MVDNSVLNNKKVLILIPGKNARGGVNNYFSALRNHLDEKSIHYIYRGSRNYPYHDTFIKQVFRLISDYLIFIRALIRYHYDLVHINMTLDRRGIFRDSVYLVIAKLFRKKTIVFYRGWDTALEKRIEKNYQRLFGSLFFKADAKIVLGQIFKDFLVRMGYRKPIYVETTTFNIDLTGNIDIPALIKDRYHRKDISTLLYLSRIEEQKGIFICLEAFRLLKPKYPGLTLVFAGDGQDLDRLQSKIRELELNDVIIKGFVTSQAKVDTFKTGGIFLFPTDYLEGMPNAILEAMAFGLPVITRELGGIPDVVKHQENGYITKSKDPAVFAQYIEILLNNPEVYQEIAIRNHENAIRKYSSAEVAKRLQYIYQDMLSLT